VCSNDWAAVTGDTKSSNISGTRHTNNNITHLVKAIPAYTFSKRLNC
jgi:hypothetical protein